MRSKKHRLGFSYAPRLLDPELAERAEPVPIKLGQALLFVLSLVHGGGINNGTATRFSADIRLVNSLAPVTHSRGVHDDYYAPLDQLGAGPHRPALRRRQHGRHAAAEQTR